jgi:hypothetical protein
MISLESALLYVKMLVATTQPHDKTASARWTRAIHPEQTKQTKSAQDAITDEGTLTIGWVGLALLEILIAAFGWAGRAFEWLGTLATWLFSGEWGEEA